MRLDPRRSSGFTLIELLIVVAIIATVSATSLGFFSRAHDASWELQARADVQDASRDVQRHLLADVASARQLEVVGGDPASLSLQTSDGVEVSYRIDDAGRLWRATDGTRTLLAEQVESLSWATPVRGTVDLDIKFVYTDGAHVRRFERSFTAFSRIAREEGS